MKAATFREADSQPAYASIVVFVSNLKKRDRAQRPTPLSYLRRSSRLFSDRKIPKVSRAADGTRPNMPSRVAMRECEFGGLRGGLESDVESHRGQVGDVVADLSLGDHAAGVIVGAEVVKSGGGVGK